MAKYKRTNLGVKEEYGIATKEPKNKMYYPSFYVKKKLPLVKTDIGKSFEVKAKVKLTGMRQDTNENRDDFNYDFNIINIQF